MYRNSFTLVILLVMFIMDPRNASSASAIGVLTLPGLRARPLPGYGPGPDEEFDSGNETDGTHMWPHVRMRDRCCCNDWQFESLVVIGTTALVTLFLWNSVLLAPFKLIAVFLHEFSHALATWVTCGRVVAIQVSVALYLVCAMSAMCYECVCAPVYAQINENYGGMIRTDGGVRWLILSAGYTGSVVWGCFFMLMSWTKGATRVAAGLFMLSCVGTCVVLRIEVRPLTLLKLTP